jgi:hypothetical protein
MPARLSRLLRRCPNPGDLLHRLLVGYNDLHPLTTLGRLTPNHVHTGQQAEILAAQQVRQAQALDRHRDAGHAPFTL